MTNWACVSPVLVYYCGGLAFANCTATSVPTSLVSIFRQMTDTFLDFIGAVPLENSNIMRKKGSDTDLPRHYVAEVAPANMLR